MDKRIRGTVLAAMWLAVGWWTAVFTPPNDIAMVLKWCIGVPLVNCVVAYMCWRMYGNG